MSYFYISDFLTSRQRNPNFEEQTDEELCITLKEFSACVRTQDGTEYSRSGYRNLWSGIQRHLQSPPYNRTVDLRNDKVFMTSNNVYEGKLKDLKKCGIDVTTHKNPISATDMAKIYDSDPLDTTNPVDLQRKVFF